MNYLTFEKAFRDYPVFSIKDIRKRFTDFDIKRLGEWRNKGYLMMVKRGHYCFQDRHKGEQFLYYAANKIYTPSYISLESALSYYNLIPEGVFTTVSVTTRNTASYDTSIGAFEFRHLKPRLYFGYRLINEGDLTIRMAEPEKVLLDYFYLNTLNNDEDIRAVRINKAQALELIDRDVLGEYQELFDSKVLNKRIRIFLKIINA
ncbi:MAG: hypothetical protein DRI69_04830 [Bacteroidetes bacterium]|nr:MAG: hypothetical protein DRI69_04830 [Bacteroidota bacterium]